MPMKLHVTIEPAAGGKGATTADVPPDIAAEYKGARRPQAIAEATGDGYTKTKKMQEPKPKSSQFGLPKSGKKKAPPTK